jgi:hypothetical protein
MAADQLLEQLNDSRCRSCAAPIRWATTTSGKRIPLDPGRAFDGNITLDADLLGGVVATVHGTPPHHLPDRYVAHFVTCPHADAWRQR